MDKKIIKLIVYCPYDDCPNYNKPGNQIKIQSFKNYRFMCKVCGRTFKFELPYHIFIRENNLNIENIEDLKVFIFCGREDPFRKEGMKAHR